MSANVQTLAVARGPATWNGDLADQKRRVLRWALQIAGSERHSK